MYFAHLQGSKVAYHTCHVYLVLSINSLYSHCLNNGTHDNDTIILFNLEIMINELARKNYNCSTYTNYLYNI